jgi:Zn-dependent peptidase ImmA (M78 family)
MEAEANYFAMCLLMPESMVREYMKTHTIDLSEDGGLKRIAKTFEVSLPVAAKRLTQLGFM